MTKGNGFVKINKPTKRHYNPKDFQKGDFVRIYLAWQTDTEIHIREGEVLATETRRKRFDRQGPILTLRVSGVGKIIRDDPRTKEVYGSGG